MNRELVSVIMSVYNGEKYLKEAIKSILKQTYINFEFIIINDGSTDKSLKIIQKYSDIDKRIIIINNKENRGLIYSLNKGFELARGKYIARMDADDISEKNRLEEQVNFLEKNIDVAMCSTYIKIFKNNFGIFLKKFKTDTSSDKIKVKLLFRNYIAHPTIMIRKEIVKKYNLKYRSEDKGIEDYGLWLYLSKYEKIETIPKYLLKYRFLNSSISSKTLKGIEGHKIKLENLFTRTFKEREIKVSREEIKIHTEISLNNNLVDYKYSLQEKSEYLRKLLKILREQDYNTIFLEEEINDQLLNCKLNSKESYIKIFKSSRVKMNKVMLIRKMIIIIILKKIKKILR